MSAQANKTKGGTLAGEYVDATQADEQTLRELLKYENRPLRFDWENRWLRGEEYAHIIERMD